MVSHSEFNSIEDLAFSRSFRHWVLHRDSPENEFWESWLVRNPDKAEAVKHAKALIYVLTLERPGPDEQEIDEEVRKALVRIKDAPRYIPLDGPERRPGNGRSRWLSPKYTIPAALFVFVCVAAFNYFRAYSPRSAFQTFLSARKYEPVRQQAAGNSSGLQIQLPDGSIVRLGKGSKLFYVPVRSRNGGPREVYLRGEAYFDVRPDPAATFIVHTDGLVVRALGTRFIVRAFPAAAKSAVTVLSGKVAVSLATAGNGNSGIVLTRNQEAIVDQAAERLQKTVAERPELPDNRPDTGLVFRGTAVSRVFAELEGLYGIPIQFDGAAADSCSLTATLDNRSFYAKLNLICQSIGATYESIDGYIVVTARRRK